MIVYSSDADADGVVDFSEFCSMVTLPQNSATRKFSTIVLEYIEKYALLDCHDDGTVAISAVLDFFQLLDSQLSLAELCDMLRHCGVEVALSPLRGPGSPPRSFTAHQGWQAQLPGFCSATGQQALHRAVPSPWLPTPGPGACELQAGWLARGTTPLSPSMMWVMCGRRHFLGSMAMVPVL